MALAVGLANFEVEFVFPTSEEMGHPIHHFVCKVVRVTHCEILARIRNRRNASAERAPLCRRSKAPFERATRNVGVIVTFHRAASALCVFTSSRTVTKSFISCRTSGSGKTSRSIRAVYGQLNRENSTRMSLRSFWARRTPDCKSCNHNRPPQPLADTTTHAATITRRSFLAGDESAWARREREKLKRQCVRALECQSEVWLANGEPALAVEAAQEALTIEPFRESAYRLLMRSHALVGNRAEGVLAYHDLRNRLVSELGTDPSKETEALYLELLA